MAASGRTRGAKAKPDDAATGPVGVRTLNLALQGGGAHGAFTWGVLDRLLEDPRIRIEGISGTSAGAMNGAMLVQGFEDGGADGARAALDAFWRRIGEAGQLAPVQRTPFDALFGDRWNLDSSPAYLWFDAWSRVLSPYQFNPLNLNPLRDVLAASVDPGRLAECQAVKLYVSATNVRSGKIKVFERGEVTVDALLASACLPFVFQAVEVDGEAYWDGGYMGNPALFPLIYGCRSPDIAIVQINPLTRDEVPTTASDIADRVNEISFNSTLMREMRAIAFVGKLIDDEGLARSKYKRLNMHMIGAESEMKGLGVSSKVNVDWAFLTHLKRIGRDTADDWLAAHFDRIGVDSTIDIPAVFL